MKSNYHIISTVFFVLVILLAHLFSSAPYDWTKNTISDLGAQGYARKQMMQIGFLGFGIILSIGVLLNSMSWRTAPVLFYGLCVGLTGVFCTKPFDGTKQYSVVESDWHSTFAQLAGVAFSIGILAQIPASPDRMLKLTHLSFFLAVIGLSAIFGLLINHQGIAQRALYLVSFIWLVWFYKP